MIIKSNIKDYEVFFEKDKNFIEDLASKENTQYVIDQKVYTLYMNLFSNIPKDRLIIIEATEEKKVLDTALDICEKITEIPAKRNATLVSIGGGIIQDITGFVANIIYRGIKWIFIPTTLLAACDSCIGGKTSLNYKKYKNLLGTFFPPNEIHIFPEFFKTLTEKDYKSGLGEVVKFNIMSGIEGLDSIENYIDVLLQRDEKIIIQFVENSLFFKKKFIELDEFDRGERIKLNFAHTFGHAIEVVTKYEIPHGTAVAIGMIMANYISYNRGYISETIINRSEKVLLKVITIDVNLLIKPLELYIDAIRKDKKQINESLTAVLITKYSSYGELSVMHDITIAEIDAAIHYFINLYEGNVESKM